MIKIAAVVVLSCMVLTAKPVKVITRQQMIRECPFKLSVQERAALNATKTKLDAALMLQSIYQDRVEFWENREQIYFSRSGLSASEYIEVTGHTSTADWKELTANRIIAEEALAAISKIVDDLSEEKK